MSKIRTLPMTNNSSPYLPQLTWLRGIAALLVIVSHTVRSTEESYGVGDIPSDAFLLKALDLGAFGVALFFALSGATLYISHCNDNVKTQFLPFAAKRTLRIFPAYIVSMIVFILATPVFSALYTEPRGLWIEYFYKPYTLTDIFQHLTMVHDLIGNPYSINPVYWTLSVEFRYYLMFPLALLALQINKPIYVILLSAAITSMVLLPGFNPSIPHAFWLTSSFFGGILVAYFCRNSNSAGRYKALWLMPIFAAASFVMWSRNDLPDIPTLRIIHTYNVALCIAAIYITLTSDFSFMPIAAKTILSFLGKISYSIYLYHLLALTVLFFAAMKLQLHGNTKAYFVLVMTCIFTIPIAYLSYRLTEKPFIDYSKGIGRKRKQSPTQDKITDDNLKPSV